MARYIGFPRLDGIYPTAWTDRAPFDMVHGQIQRANPGIQLVKLSSPGAREGGA